MSTRNHININLNTVQKVFGSPDWNLAFEEMLEITPNEPLSLMRVRVIMNISMRIISPRKRSYS